MNDTLQRRAIFAMVVVATAALGASAIAAPHARSASGLSDNARLERSTRSAKTAPRTKAAPTTKPTRGNQPVALGDDITNREFRDNGAGYTGVIIDAKGLGLQRSMSPRVRSIDGADVWTGAHASPEYAIEHGIVGYAKSMDEALASARVGARPLVIRARSRAEGPFRSDPVLEDADVAALREADRTNGILKRFRIVLLID